MPNFRGHSIVSLKEKRSQVNVEGRFSSKVENVQDRPGRMFGSAVATMMDGLQNAAWGLTGPRLAGTRARAGDTTEIAAELYIARDILSQKRNKCYVSQTWISYCQEIGLLSGKDRAFCAHAYKG